MTGTETNAAKPLAAKIINLIMTEGDLFAASGAADAAISVILTKCHGACPGGLLPHLGG